MIYGDPRLRSPEAILRSTGTPPDLWKYGISGDLPIVLVTVADAGHLSLAQELVSAQEYLRARGFKFDLVVLNEIPTSYRQDVQDDLQRMAEASPSHAWLDRPGGLFLRRADLLAEEDRVLLRAVARAILEGAHGGLDVQMRRPLVPSPPPPKIKMQPAVPAQSEPAPVLETLVFANGFGGFTPDGREFHVSARPPAPWSNVIANERFGFIATDSGFGATWSENSYHNRLTPWSNDPIVDPPSEVVYLRDDKSGEFWTATPGSRARSGEARREIRAGIRDLQSSAPRARRGAHRVCARARPRQDSAAPYPQRHHHASRVERLLLRGLVFVRHPHPLGGPHRHGD